MPLATLHHDLNEYLALLKAKVTVPAMHITGMQLVEVINDDYGDYVSLSSRLVNVDGFVVRLRKPLVELKVQNPFRIPQVEVGTLSSHLHSRPMLPDPLLRHGDAISAALALGE